MKVLPSSDRMILFPSLFRLWGNRFVIEYHDSPAVSCGVLYLENSVPISSEMTYSQSLPFDRVSRFEHLNLFPLQKQYQTASSLQDRNSDSERGRVNIDNF